MLVEIIGRRAFLKSIGILIPEFMHLPEVEIDVAVASHGSPSTYSSSRADMRMPETSRDGGLLYGWFGCFLALLLMALAVVISVFVTMAVAQ